MDDRKMGLELVLELVLFLLFSKNGDFLTFLKTFFFILVQNTHCVTFDLR